MIDRYLYSGWIKQLQFVNMGKYDTILGCHGDFCMGRVTVTDRVTIRIHFVGSFKFFGGKFKFFWAWVTRATVLYAGKV